MEIDTMPHYRLKCPILSTGKLKVEPKEKNDSKINSRSEHEKVVDLYLKCNGQENCSDDEFIESRSIRKIKDEKEELDQKGFDICLEESSYIKWETKNFTKIEVESDDRNIDKEFNDDIMKPCIIKKESIDVNKIESKEWDYGHEGVVKSENIKQEEVHIKDEENEHRLNEKVPKSGKQTLLHQCPECPYSTIHKCNLKTHFMKHKKVDEIDWHSCPKCPYKTFRKRDLMRHTKIHDTDNPILESKSKYLHCPECSFQTHLQWYFRSHVLAHKGDTFKCPKCSYQSSTKRQLTVHQHKHKSKDKWYSCPLCSFKTYTRNTFKVHCERRHGIDHNNFKQIEILKCTKCTYESGCKGDLKKHQLIHNQNNWLQCPDCAYNTPYKRNWRRHQVRYHGGNAEGYYRCPECPYKTSEKSSLKKHILSHKSAEDILWFECSECSFKTVYKDNLMHHQLKHKEAHEVDWFFCYECSFKTKHKSYLPAHMSTHKKQIGKLHLQNS